MNEERIERRFDVTSDASLWVSNIRGHIEVQSGDDGVIEVTAIKHLASGDCENTEISIEQDENGRVNARTDYPDRIAWLSWGKPCKVTYQVRVPQQCTLTIKGISSGISVSGVDGTARIRSVSGDVEIDSLTGELNLRCVSGSVRAKNYTGPVSMDMVSGSADFAGSQVPRIDCKTVSGAITLETSLQEGPYRFNSVSAKVVLVVPPDSTYTAKLNSMSGRIKTSLPGSITHRNGREARLTVGEGGPQVSLKSISGNLYLVTSRSDLHGIVAAKTKPEKKAQPDRMDILDRIENGEIDVDQAIRELT